MASKIREKIGSKLGSIEKRIESAFEKTLEKTLQTAMNSPLTAKAANAAEAVQARVEKARTSAKGAAKDAKSLAQATAKQSLDQVLLGLEHKLENKGVDVQQKKDLVYAVGKKVLERAEVIRGQVAANPMAPTWIKGMNLNDLMPKASAAPTKASTEVKVEVGATEGDAALAEAAAQGDGEAEEALEASPEEKSAGVIAEGAKVTPSQGKSSKSSTKASGKTPIEEAVANTQAGVKQAEAKAKSKKKTSSTETTH